MAEQEYKLSPFITPNLTDAVEQTLRELQDQGVNLDELKDKPKIPIRRQDNPDALNTLVNLKSKGAPIPGQSLINSPEEPRAWEQPATYSSPRMALDHILDLVLDEEVLPAILDSIHGGAGLTDIASAILYTGFTEGKWTPDTMMLLMEPTLYILMNIAEEANIEYIIDIDGAKEENQIDRSAISEVINDKDEGILQTVKNTVLNKGISEASVPKEILERISSEVPSLLQREPDLRNEESLLMRNTNA